MYLLKLQNLPLAKKHGGGHLGKYDIARLPGVVFGIKIHEISEFMVIVRKER